MHSPEFYLSGTLDRFIIRKIWIFLFNRCKSKYSKLEMLEDLLVDYDYLKSFNSNKNYTLLFGFTRTYTKIVKVTDDKINDQLATLDCYDEIFLISIKNNFTRINRVQR